MRLFISIILFIFIFNISQAIQVSGDVFGTWGAEDNPYEVIGDFHVPQCSTLVLEAGCFIDFQGYYKLEVDTGAVFRALGSESDSIVFTTSDTLIGWNGIRLYAADSTSKIQYCIVEYGRALEVNDFPYNHGGGFYIEDMDISITNCNIRYNKAPGGYGGGICCNNTSLIMTNNKLCNNEAGFAGGGLSCSNSSIHIDSNIVIFNSVSYPLGGGYGGGIQAYDCRIIMSNNLISSNFCQRCGGGIYIIYSEYCSLLTNLINCNDASDGGGGIFIASSDSVGICSNIITNNIVAFEYAGGLMCSHSSAFISNNTIAYNSARYKGAGITFGRNNDVQLVNNNIWGNTCPDSSQIYDFDSVAVAYYSCIQYGWPGEGNIDSDPMFVDPDGGDFHLSWDNYPVDDDTKSPCIDAGAPWSPLDPDSTRADMGALSFDQHVGIDDTPDRLPRQVRLEQNYPNPFNAQTVISYALPVSSQVRLEIYDILGRKVSTLIDRQQPSGYHQAVWRADDLSSGIYFYKLQAGDYILTKKMLLVK